MCLEARVIMKKIVFFDVDGTLVTRNNHIPKSTKRAIKTLKKNDILPVVATGRAPVLVREIVETLEIDTYIAMNGQYIVHKGEVIYQNAIPIKLVDQVVKFAVERKDGIVLSTADEIIANSAISLVNRGYLYMFLKGLLGIIPNRIKVKMWNRMMSKAPEREAYMNKEIFMMNINANSKEQVAYERAFGDVLAFTRANEMAMDIINKETSKATGIEKLAEELGVSIDNTYAFGDGLNDLEMLQKVGTGVAMENGYDELKLAADMITDSVFSDGIEKGLRQLELI